MHLKKSALLPCLTLCMLLASAFTLQNADEDVMLHITQVDTSRFPTVIVYVSVTDAGGHPLGVDPDRLMIRENGAAVNLEAVSGMGELQSVTTMLVIDVSGSMETAGKLPSAKASAVEYIRQMRPHDQAGLISYNTQALVRQSITDDKDALMSAVNSLESGGDTAMYDALMAAENALEDVPGRKTIILLTDGLDNRSSHNAADVIAGIGPAGLSISVIGLGDATQEDYLWTSLDEQALTSLAEAAGGKYSFVNDPDGLQALYQQLGYALQSEFAITYTSPSVLRDGLKRMITVELLPEGAGAGVEGEPLSYNPGGLFPEVADPHTWWLFCGLMLLMLFLLVLPSLISWLKERRLRRKEELKDKKLKPISIDEIKRVKLK